MKTPFKSRGLIAVAVLLAAATLESFLAPADASVGASTDVAYTSSSPLPLATLGLESTAALPWVGKGRAEQFEVDEEEEYVSSTQGDVSSLCSVIPQGDSTCSTGFGAGGDTKTCSTWSATNSCSAIVAGLCSASVHGGGAASEQCSAFSQGSECSTFIPSQNVGACSATGYAACSALAHKGARCSAIHLYSGSCSVTRGQGGVCTTFALSSQQAECSTFHEIAGHCSVWGGGEPPVGPDDWGLCNG